MGKGGEGGRAQGRLNVLTRRLIIDRLSGRYLQATLMSIPAGGDIGLEMHAETDQFLRLDAGRGRVQMGPAKDRLTFDQDVSDGWCVLVLAGTWHNVTNIGEELMQVYATERQLFSKHFVSRPPALLSSAN